MFLAVLGHVHFTTFHYTKEDIRCLDTFNVIIILLCQTLIINSFVISVRHECKGIDNYCRVVILN